ncbi:MAG: glucose-6-phosphate dehydrogenase [Gammaproteobacteria bacterium]
MASRDVTEPFEMVVFGGAGDLARRKLLPALYHLDRQGRLGTPGRILAVMRRATTRESYLAQVQAACKSSMRPEDFSAEVWERFAARLDTLQFDAADAQAYAPLAGQLGNEGFKVRVFYLATPPALFGPVARHLSESGLVHADTRLVLEKPIGHDLQSSRAINAEVRRGFAEDQIYRIDHYLGKETVQNLMVLRFANSLFEPLWNRTHIDHVQITVAETVGVGGRWAFYDAAGTLRDMVQNHMLQLLCLTAMEPPNSLDADAIRDEKVKVLKALLPIAGEACLQSTVRGQYREGVVLGDKVPGYADEPDAAGPSRTETFVAVRTGIDNWRWSGVPFYLRSGKRLAHRCSEVVVSFRAPPHAIYPRTAQSQQPNRLVLRLQPDESVRLHMLNKLPGPGETKLRQAPLNLSFADAFGTGIPDAYERLLLDVLRGNPSLFMRGDELEAAWRWTDGILSGWDLTSMPVKGYAAGSSGPTTAVALIERDGRTWHDDDF